ncbi:hypothetical protein GCM10009603_01860 [Nocardiopsis exhalans]
MAADRVPEKAVVPSLDPLADPGSTVDSHGAVLLTERGFAVRTVRGAVTALHGWIRPARGPSAPAHPNRCPAPRSAG